MIISADLSQIEVVLAAQESKDETLCQLLNDGRDLHRFMVAKVYNESESGLLKSDPRRKPMKAGTFGMLYGNGAKTMSENTRQSVEWCEGFIKTFYETFPGIKKWHDRLIKEVTKTGEYTTFTGRRLVFKKYYEVKQPWQIPYKKPDIKNWRIQSLAADLYKLWLTEVFKRSIQNRHKWLLINAIHDAIMLDCKPEYVIECQKMLQETVDIIPELCYNTWKEKLIVPVKVEISIGDRWSNLKEISEVSLV